MKRTKKAYIHFLSLVYARAFNFFYWSLGKNAFLTNFFLEKYRKVRRKLPGGPDPQTGLSTRYGAHEAYLETQEEPTVER